MKIETDVVKMNYVQSIQSLKNSVPFQCAVGFCPICHLEVKIPLMPDVVDWQSLYYQEIETYKKIIDSMRINILQIEKIVKEMQQ